MSSLPQAGVQLVRQLVRNSILALVQAFAIPPPIRLSAKVEGSFASRNFAYQPFGAMAERAEVQ